MSFSTSVARVGDTTGYTSNKGVWAKAMFHQKQGPFTKKRKKWIQNFGDDPACYKISEREEEDEVKLPQIVAPGSSRAVPIIETSSKQVLFAPDRALDRAPEVPEIVVEEVQPPERSAPDMKQEKPELNTGFLMLPKQVNNKAHFVRTIPEAAVYDVRYEHKEEEPTETQIDSKSQRYFTAPKYTHIRVPRRHLLITHVSQESINSPLKFPRIDTETVCRKPVTVTLTKSLNLERGRVRRRWNFSSLNEPIQIYTRPESASSTTSEISPNPESLESSNRKTDSHDERQSAKKSPLLCDSNLSNPGDTGHGRDNKCVVSIAKNGAISKTSPRKKWVLPEHWPSLEKGPGQ